VSIIGLVTLILTHKYLSFFFILFIVIRNVRTSIKNQGLNKRLPDHHPLIAISEKLSRLFTAGSRMPQTITSVTFREFYISFTMNWWG